MEGFEGLTSAFNIDEKEYFEKIIKEVDKDINVIEIKKNEIVTKVKTTPTLYQDQDFIRTELKTLIMSSRTVMYKVEQDIKIGADARKIEVYAKLLEAVGKQYQSLMELDKNIFEAQVRTNSFDISNLGNNRISLSSEQLLDMINKASSESQMNAIDAHFEIKD